MSDKKKPFERNMLVGLNEKSYVKKLEKIIVSEGKRILQSLRVNHHVVSNKNMQKYQDRYPQFIKTRWHQVGLRRLFDCKVINTYQYQLLIMMRQVLNKNDIYLLRGNEFEYRNYALECDKFKKGETCYQDDCRAVRVCPFYFKNKKGA